MKNPRMETRRSRFSTTDRLAATGLAILTPLALALTVVAGSAIHRASAAERAQSGGRCLLSVVATVEATVDARTASLAGRSSTLNITKSNAAVTNQCRALDVNDSWQSARLALQVASADTTDNRASTWTTAVLALQSHLYRVAEESGLRFDSNRPVHYLADILVAHIPVLIDQGARVRDAVQHPHIATAPEREVLRAEALAVRTDLRRLHDTASSPDIRSVAEQWGATYEQLKLSTAADINARVAVGPDLDKQSLAQFRAVIGERLTSALGAIRSAANQRSFGFLAIALLLGILLSSMLFRVITTLRRRIARTASAVGAATSGRYDDLVPVEHDDDFGSIETGVNHLLTQLQEARAGLDRSATTDATTGLPNRSETIKYLAEAIARQTRDDLLAAIVVDLGNLEVVNDNYGDLTGDRVLRSVAERLQRHVGPTARVTRLSGVQYCVIAEAMSSHEQLEQRAARIVELLRSPIALEDATIELSEPLAGVAFRSADQLLGPEQLLDDAEAAVRAARDDRRAVCVFDAEVRRLAKRRTEMRAEMRLPVGPQAAGFYLQYAPVVDGRTGKVTSFTSALRWWHPRFGEVPMAEFLELAETTGTLGSLGTFTLNEALGRLREWRTSEESLSIGVSLHRAQLVPELVEDVTRALRDNELPAQCLIVQVEADQLDGFTLDQIRVLRTLRAEGSGLVIEKFSSAFVSPQDFATLEPSGVALDPRLTTALGSNEEDDPGSAMAMAVTGFAHKLGLWVTAEGVASTVQLESAYRLGCDFFSGPLTGGYVDAETASALLGPVEAESSSAESTSAEEGSSEPVSV